MKSTIKIAAFLLLAAMVMSVTTTKDDNSECLLSKVTAICGDHTKPYVILGEYKDAKSQKLYMANNVKESYKDVDEDFFDSTFLIVFNVQTKKKDTLRCFETTNVDGSGFIDFYHYEKGKLYFTETFYRGGNSLYCVNVYTDKIKLVASNIVADEDGVSKIRVKNGVLYYTKSICINEDEAKYESDKEYVFKEYSIRI